MVCTDGHRFSVRDILVNRFQLSDMTPVRNRDISPFGIIFQDDVNDPGNGI